MTSRRINNPDQTFIKYDILGGAGLNDRLECQGCAPIFQRVSDGIKDIRIPFRHSCTQWVGEILLHLDLLAFVKGRGHSPWQHRA